MRGHKCQSPHFFFFFVTICSEFFCSLDNLASLSVHMCVVQVPAVQSFLKKCAGPYFIINGELHVIVSLVPRPNITHCGWICGDVIHSQLRNVGSGVRDYVIVVCSLHISFASCLDRATKVHIMRRESHTCVRAACWTS